MANMSYCRFENTSGDLRDCVEALEEAEDLKSMRLNEYEYEAMREMRELCTKYLEQSYRILYADEQLHRWMNRPA